MTLLEKIMGGPEKGRWFISMFIPNLVHLEYIRCSITLECGNSQGRRIFRSGKRVGNT